MTPKGPVVPLSRLEEARWEVKATDDAVEDSTAQFSVFAVALDGEGAGPSVDVRMVDHPVASLASPLVNLESLVVLRQDSDELAVLERIRHRTRPPVPRTQPYWRATGGHRWLCWVGSLGPAGNS